VAVALSGLRRGGEHFPLALANPALPDQIEDMLRRAELPPFPP
jgi:hypothetical protein